MRYAVLCAANPGNSGMYSVDRAAIDFFSAAKLDHQLFISQQKRAKGRRFGKLNFSFVNQLDALGGFSHLIYWGDFLNNPHYGSGDFSLRELKFGNALDQAEAYNRWSSIFAPKGKHGFHKIISAGNNFQHNFREDNGSLEALSNIEANFDCIFPRDSFSLKVLANNFNFTSLSMLTQGLDCAFLLDRDILRPKQETFCYHFGRTGYSNVESLVRNIESATGLTGVELTDWLKLKAKSADLDFQEMRNIISASRFTLTDTYHLCINSITLGTTVIGLGAASPAQDGTLGDFKKQQLFFDLGLNKYYITTDKIDNRASNEIVSLAVTHSRDNHDSVPEFSYIFQMINVYRNRLIEKLTC